jgi:ribose transport system ATP-binding protein
VAEVVLRLREAGRAYSGFPVLSGISLDVEAGECVAVVGENGAGKSTLMKLITGMELPTAGEVSLGSPLERVRSVRAARSRGTVLIPQELAYVPQQSVAYNVSLGAWPSRLGFIRRRETQAEARRIMRRLGNQAEVGTPMARLTLGQRQIVEIAKAITARELTLLCLDEPTAALNAEEANSLIDLLSALKRQGVALIYVSHRLDELRRVADRVLVLRNGQNVGLLPTGSVTPADLASRMLGRPHAAQTAHRTNVRPRTAASAPAPTSIDDAELAVCEWWSDADPPLRGVSFSVRAGEIVGLYGLAGSGVETVARGLGGLLSSKNLRGTIRLREVERRPFHSPLAARRAEVVLLPSDRANEGLLLSRPIPESLSLGRLSAVSRFGFIQSKQERAMTAEAMATFDISTRGGAKDAGRLSGGNQQKVLLANRLLMHPRVLVLHEPTRGVDIGARAQIHDVLRRQASEGKAVIVATTDIDEVVALSDKVLVFRGGEIRRELIGDEVTGATVLEWAAQGGGDYE